jgi:NAD(P)-dependent dehydrogenase (short-subunit alcohol dehydrogenase family)
MKKNIVIFGGSGLLGKEICASLKNSGNNLINFDIKDNTFVKTFKIKDLSNSEIVKTISKSKKILGSIDCLIVCIYPKKYFPKSNNLLKNSTKNYLDDINDHFGSYLRINLEYIRYFKKIKSGNIINFSSIYSKFLPRFEIYENTKMGVPLSYFLSKSSIVSFSKYLSKYFLKSQIRINTISPGGIFDNQNERFVKNYLKFCSDKKMLSPKSIISVLNMLISDKSKSITGQDFIIDDGFTL